MSPKRFFFILLATIAVLLVGGGLGYLYGLHTLAAKKASLANALGEQATMDEQLSNLAALKSQYNREIVPVLPLIEGALPQTKNQTEILLQLQTLAQTNGLSLTGVSLPSAAGLPGATSQTVKAGNVLALPVTFSLQGTYQQLQSFLVKVENLNRFTNVTSLAVSKADKTNTVTYSMTVNAYVKP